MALNPTGLVFRVTATDTRPSAFSETQWAISGPRADGADIVLFTVPTGSAGATTQVQKQINGGAWTYLCDGAAGVYPITGLTVETAYSIKLRAVNASGQADASAAKDLFTIPVDPRGFRGWNPTVDLGTTGDVFVAPYGNDSTGTGLVAAPFATLTKALTVATTGQKIKVRAGTYREKCTISTASVKVEGYGTEKPTFTAADALTGWEQCSAADAAVIGPTLGISDSPVYKTTISKTGWDYTDVSAMNIYEAGRRVYVPSDRADPTLDMFSPNSATFWVADSFTINGSNQVTAIVDASVINSSRYTEAELLAASVLVYHSPNVVSTVNVTAVNLGTNTITVDGLKPTTGAYERRFAIQNVARALSAGTAFVVDNTTTATVYLYPYDAANLALVEFSPRKHVLTLGSVSGIELRGLAILQASGAGSDAGACVYRGTGDATRRSGYIIENCLTGKTENSVDAARAFRLQYTETTEIRSNTFWESPGRGVFIQGRLDEFTEPGVLNLIEKCHFEKIGGAGFLNYSQDDCVFAHNYSTRIGARDHANLTNAYEQNDGCVWWGNEFGPQSFGYLTWQEATDIVVAFNWIPQQSKGLNDNRAITDQNHDSVTPPPSAGGFGLVFNNSVHPDPASSYGPGPSISVANGNTDLIFTMVNNVAYAITDASDTAETPAQIGYNVITKLDAATSQTSGSFDGTNVIQQNLALVYQDAAAGDFDPASGSPILTTEGQSMAATVATLAARFTQFSGWDKDYKNQVIDWADLPMGADAGLAWVR